MKKFLFGFLFCLLFFLSINFQYSFAYDPVNVNLPVNRCHLGAAPNDLIPMYEKLGEPYVNTFEEFIVDPYRFHFWIDDPKITAQGKADERARQFLYWTVTHNSIDTHPAIQNIWNTTRNIAYVFLLVDAAIIGLGIIIGQRANFASKIPIWPSIFKLLTLLLYITFSFSIVVTIISMSDILMKFFIENLGGKDLFNLYYSNVNKEQSYIDFVACRDLNYSVQEGIDAEMFILKITNITYYVMGSMILLRKIILWFLIFVSPFLAILLPFVFIRNVGWIWIGVFFQWVFYGPLLALFLGATATIWKYGIPFNFDFSRVRTLAGYVYPTGILLLYGGPAQNLHGLNNGNYVDTFAEYIITLLMLWAITFFPWWLLRIFRDYCCDGIIAMKNILLSMYDQVRNPLPQGPGPVPTPTPFSTTTGTALKIPRDVEIPVKVRIETTEQIKKATTEDIKRSLNISASHLTDIAHFETNKQTRENINKNLNFLRNPIQAESSTDRQKFMSIRTELFNRAIKDDVSAKHVLSSITSSKMEHVQAREQILQSMPKMVPVTHVVSIKVKIPREKVATITSSFVKAAATNSQVINSIASTTSLQSQQVQSVLQSFNQNLAQPLAQITNNIVEDTKVEKVMVVKILQAFAKSSSISKEVSSSVAKLENVKEEEVAKVINTQVPILAEPEKHIEQTVSIPPTVSLEDYEQVKKMWKSQYEKGEVPVSENIKTREAWVEKDIALITNTLNKLLSSEEKLRQEGLDDVGYILPIFMVNNLKGEELLVYLKAKLEAAKAVQEDKEKEKTIKQELKPEEEFVDVAKPKVTEKEKTMEMREEIKEEK